MSKNILVITKTPYKNQDLQLLAYFEDSQLVDIQIKPDDGDVPIGNIYVGKVDSIPKSVSGIFVRYGEGKVGYLPNSDLPYAIYKKGSKEVGPRVGDELLVQVEKEAIKLKQPALTTRLSIGGRYFVLSNEGSCVNFSKKFNATDKKQLKKSLDYLEDCPWCVIIRTAALYEETILLQEEFRYLMEQMEYITKLGVTRQVYQCIYENATPPALYVRKYDSPDFHVLTDLESVYMELSEGHHVKKGIMEPVYKDPLLPLYKLYRIEHFLQELEQKKVWLQSGGFLVIEETEAFVAIDVNTGKFVTKKDPEETFFKINMEACYEAARQIRLRSLSGIILIDFINMKRTEELNILLTLMRDLLAKDTVQARAIDFTALQIMEITRKKARMSLKEQLKPFKK